VLSVHGKSITVSASRRSRDFRPYQEVLELIELLSKQRSFSQNPKMPHYPVDLSKITAIESLHSKDAAYASHE
jgi:hypothetical protein